MTIGRVGTRDRMNLLSADNIPALRRNTTLGQVIHPLGRGLIFERVHMPKKKHGLTVGEHINIGAHLKVIRDELVHMSVQIGNAYPKASPQDNKVVRATNYVDSLRCLLDDCACREHPHHFDVNWYYGQRDSK